MSDLTERLRHVAWLAEEGSEVTDLAAAAADALEAAEAKLAAIDALHSDPFTEEGDQFCHECVGQWPCRTYRILHPEEDQ